MARCHLSLSSLFIILEGEQHWSATILASFPMNYLSCRFKTSRLCTWKNVNWVYPKKESSGFAYCLLFCSYFQDISIKYGMIVFQNLMISFSSIEYGCSCTCSCQKQDPCTKHWIRIVSKWWFWHDFLRKRLTLTPKTETLSVKISRSSVFTENVSCIYFESPHTEFK